jgi:hypothetical protein
MVIIVITGQMAVKLYVLKAGWGAKKELHVEYEEAGINEI